MAEDLTARVFGKWTVTGLARVDRTKRFWHCRCACGEERVVVGYSLKTGGSVSCGCAHTKSQEAHGLSRSAEYGIWQQMKNRCLKPSVANYHRYGGRGITVAPEWIDSFQAFYADMGRRPKGRTLERMDNDGPYSKDNCRWASQKEQSNNTRRNRKITLRGRTQSFAQWVDELGVNGKMVYARMAKLRWTPERAFFTPHR